MISMAFIEFINIKIKLFVMKVVGKQSDISAIQLWTSNKFMISYRSKVVIFLVFGGLSKGWKKRI